MEDGLEKTMDCCLGNGILLHSGVLGPSSSLSVDMLLYIAQGGIIPQ
jgi:hypothetical protein